MGNSCSPGCRWWFVFMASYVLSFFRLYVLDGIWFLMESVSEGFLTYSYTQHALRPVIYSKINHIRHFIKTPFINKGMDFIDLPSIFRDKSVQSSIPNYFRNCEVPIICYKYNNLLGALYLISINLFLILISKLVSLTLELARTLNMFIRLQVMLLRAI